MSKNKYAEQSWRAFLASDANNVPPKFATLRKQMKLGFMAGFAAGRTAQMVDGVAEKMKRDSIDRLVQNELDHNDGVKRKRRRRA